MTWQLIFSLFYIFFFLSNLLSHIMQLLTEQVTAKPPIPCTPSEPAHRTSLTWPLIAP